MDGSWLEAYMFAADVPGVDDADLTVEIDETAGPGGVYSHNTFSLPT